MATYFLAHSFLTFSRSGCALVHVSLPISVSVDLASSVAADDALLLLGIPEVSTSSAVYFV